MGDLGHPLPPVNCRKRKADAEEECQHPAISQDAHTPTTSDDILVGDNSVAHYAPRQPPSSPWLSTDTAHAVWPSESSPTDPSPSSPLSPSSPTADPSLRSPKRSRVDASHLPSPPKRNLRIPERQSPSRTSFVPPSPTRRSRKRPEHRGALSSPSQTTSHPFTLRIDSCFLPTDASHLLVHPPYPIDLSSPHIPSLHPLINRQTLKELDLSAILRNPQLRHDLMFDAGLQFRPTSGRRKRDLSDRYWRAVAQELETGCTCISFDSQGRPCDCLCVCQSVAASKDHVLIFSPSSCVLTLRTPSRIRLLLTEFLEVLLFVIQPLTGISDAYAHPSTLQPQIERHAAQAAHLRSVFDPDLIQQELQHDLFDPSGLFVVIGQTLKSHCAPMRDRAVDAMVEVAKQCAPGGGGTKADAVKAVRMCLEILELMKLVSPAQAYASHQDIANHQLQALRPCLVDTSGQYELKAFKGRKGQGSSLDITRKWMESSHRRLLASPILSHPTFPSGSFDYRNLTQTQKTYISVLKGLTDLVFDPPSPVPSPQCSSGSAIAAPSAMCPLPLYPETTYLDSARLLVLAADATDTAAMYMFLLLYRQLVFSDAGDSSVPRDHSRVNDAELLKLKREIRDISSSHLGHFLKYGNSDGAFGSGGGDCPADDKWCKIKRDIVLQVALRAKESRGNASSQSATSTVDTPSAPHAYAPDERTLRLAEGWSDTHIRPNSPLSTMLKNKVRDAVFSQVVALAFPPSEATTLGSATQGAPPLSSSSSSSSSSSTGLASGMEPLADEIHLLAERLARLAQIHLGVYLRLYEQEDILSGTPSTTTTIPIVPDESEAPSTVQACAAAPASLPTFSSSSVPHSTS
ncbi:T-complex protein 11-domain-containing protein [Pisolithus orientalis]|uniref:T-complex protein 11-domain-containing protein n=1 Tax=Pisolithus orientalis TaxID=936130 RepID=UPI0022243758|nr:T-complex protein 11-domain-containing protein [Pisolithus orientalis]KAI6030931.1 T-complex protein 11-domain-containing protein [Pisolithus orientalis]